MKNWRVNLLRINPLEYQRTITLEIKALQDRVRLLIADGNWAEEGRYKEAILKGIIQRQLPAQLSIGTGFIVSEENNELKRSKQIDLIIYDNTVPLLFKEGDFIVTTPFNVKGIVEVKSQLPNSQDKLIQIFSNANHNGNMLLGNTFNGIFIYNQGNITIPSDNISTQTIINGLKSSFGNINHICIGENLFIRFWDNGNPQRRPSPSCYSCYNIENLSFSYFISNLLDTITENTFDREWFRYPLHEGKERYHIIDYFEE